MTRRTANKGKMYQILYNIAQYFKSAIELSREEVKARTTLY